jgi:general secretion pathway protein F
LSIAFEVNQLTTSISLRMLRVGERSGELGAMLTQSAAFYDGEISRWIDRFARLFEPILMAIIGIVVGGIVVLLYMPIFDLAGSLS